MPLGQSCTWFRLLFDKDNQVSKVYKLSHKPAVITKNTFALYRYYGRNSSAPEFKRTVSIIQGKVVLHPPVLFLALSIQF